MTYLLSALFLQLLPLFRGFRFIMALVRGKASNPRGLLPFALALGLTFLITAPFYQSMIFVLQQSSPEGLPGTASMRGSVYLMLVGAILSFAWYAWHSWKRPGIDILALMISAYMAFVAIDQLRFFDASAGVVSMDYIAYSGQVNDIPDAATCSSGLSGGMALVRDSATEGEMIYRCPNNIVFGARGLIADPFVPWPSYQEGTSRDLAAAIAAMKASAVNH